MMIPLHRLEAFGQSIWMDFIRRGMIEPGRLKQLIEGGLGGVISNPSSLVKAITGSVDYDDAVRNLAREGKNTDQIYHTLTVEDAQRTADLFRPLHERLDGMDGFMNLDVSPNLAHDTAGTIADAKRPWRAVNRSNIMIKVPGTILRLLPVKQLISEGINVTLVFGLPRYRQVAYAYLAGLKILSASGKSLKFVSSVASFFLSPIDVLLDPMLKKRIESDRSNAEIAKTQHGQMAIFIATAAHALYQVIYASQRFGYGNTELF